MKVGMNMLLWTGHVTQEHVPVLQAIKATGFDGVEIPIFDPSDPGHFRWLAGVLDDIGLERTSVALIPETLARTTLVTSTATELWPLREKGSFARA